MTEEMCQANDPVIRPAWVYECDTLPVYVCTNGKGSLHNLMIGMRVSVCVRVCIFVSLYSNGLEKKNKKTLTQHNEVDLAPVVLSPSLDFTVVFSRVGQQQVTDQQGGVSAQVLPGKGQTAGLTARRLICVHLAPKEGNDLEILKRRKL